MSQLQMLATSSQLLSWESYYEDVSSLEESPSMTMVGLLEQVNVTRDSSDYLWYMTSVEISSSESSLHGGKAPSLYVDSAGHALHIFINGQLSGSGYGTRENRRIRFDGPVNLRSGMNRIALLSVAAGLPNIGPHFETWNTGVLGPVVLRGLDQGKIDLTWYKWSYQVGLKGEEMSLESPHSTSSNEWMQGLSAQNNQPLTWHKAYFDAPEGTEPLALDMQSMGKGQIWINGQSVGRYWTSFAKGDCNSCSYKGTYRPAKCQSGCGAPTQRWYHVPRSWVKPNQNLMVLFEELGGDASKIALVKRSVAGVCADVYENHPSIEKWHLESSSESAAFQGAKAHLHCSKGQKISSIKFASFGTPSGTCGSFLAGACHAENSQDVLEKLCVGLDSCTVAIANSNFGGDPCPQVLKKLSVEAVCTSS